MSVFQQVFSEVHNERLGDETASEQHSLTALLETPASPKWHLIENIVARRYKRLEGNAPPLMADGLTIDWPSIKTWLSQHWLQIVGILLQLLMFLGKYTGPTNHDAVCDAFEKEGKA